MIQLRRHTTIPAGIMDMRVRAPASAAIPWYLAGGAPTPIAVYQPKGAADLAASYVNLVNPGTYDAAPGVAPTLDASGWVFNANAWLSSGYAPPNTAIAVLVRVSSLANNCSLYGCYLSGASGGYWFTYRSTGGIQYGSGNESPHVSPGETAGVFAVANRSAYRNSVVDYTFSAKTASSTNPILIGCRGDGSGNPTEKMNGIMTAFSLWNTSTGHATWMPAVMAAVALI